MRISDWSSDVCSSDLGNRGRRCGGIAEPTVRFKRTDPEVTVALVNPFLAQEAEPATPTPATPTPAVSQKSGFVNPFVAQVGLDTAQNTRNTLDDWGPGVVEPDRKSTRLNSSH